MASPPARPTVRRSRGERRATYALKLLAIVVLSALILGAVLDFIGRVSSVAVILVGAVFFTYVIYPPVRRLTTRLPLIWSILVVYAAIVLIAAFGLAFIVPAFYGETQSLVRAMPQIVHNAQAFVTDPKNPLVAHLPASVRDYLAKVPAQLVGLAGGYVSTAAASIVGLALSVAGLLATLVVIPIVSVYLLIEAPDAIRTFAHALPAGARPEAMSLMHD